MIQHSLALSWPLWKSASGDWWHKVRIWYSVARRRHYWSDSGSTKVMKWQRINLCSDWFPWLVPRPMGLYRPHYLGVYLPWYQFGYCVFHFQIHLAFEMCTKLLIWFRSAGSSQVSVLDTTAAYRACRGWSDTGTSRIVKNYRIHDQVTSPSEKSAIMHDPSIVRHEALWKVPAAS